MHRGKKEKESYCDCRCTSADSLIANAPAIAGWIGSPTISVTCLTLVLPDPGSNWSKPSTLKTTNLCLCVDSSFCQTLRPLMFIYAGQCVRCFKLNTEHCVSQTTGDIVGHIGTHWVVVSKCAMCLLILWETRCLYCWASTPKIYFPYLASLTPTLAITVT